MEVIVGGLATAINFLFIYYKLQVERFEDAVVDIGIFLCIAFLFAGTMGGMVIGMIASAIISIYLWFYPPKFEF
jgi:hypothetical protein